MATFHAEIGLVVLPTEAQVLAIAVSSAVRVVLVAEPIVFTSLKSAA